MKKIILGLMLLILLGAGALGAGGWWYARQPLNFNAPKLEFTVPRGAGMRQAASAIVAAGVDIDPRLLTLIARFAGKEKAIKAGSYEIHPGMTPLQLIEKLVAGDVTQDELLLIEGWTFRQIRAALENCAVLENDLKGLSDADIMGRIGEREDLSPEGLFFPDTYLFDRHSGALAVLARAREAMKSRLEAEWAARAPDLPLASPYEALILASIVEKETGHAAERGQIAAVFINRLRQGMRLQTDPTVIYGLGEAFDGNLRRVHLVTDHPWNTYMREGLPPTPIAMPGLASLQAVLHPAAEAEDLLYFVARGDGTSEFSRNLADHNRAVDRYQRGRRTGSQ
ncbi:MAG: endolytic transglycosylase MltG [Azoarcus sp.]|jgi:UPF0755 protein|nr:endolytic transglycosylase MltG [Azoarcus sp.]